MATVRLKLEAAIKVTFNGFALMCIVLSALVPTAAQTPLPKRMHFGVSLTDGVLVLFVAEQASRIPWCNQGAVRTGVDQEVDGTSR